ncbi:MAG: hypothetical protein KatS3mg085_144 [Candidatus Dojkabacteria bacterium]|nr:MAG: hypothetical protein KatS3mg085_144 [Candidatus Dojkabacteria bacterium]
MNNMKKNTNIFKIFFATVLTAFSVAVLLGLLDLNGDNSKIIDNSDLSAGEASLSFDTKMINDTLYEVVVNLVNNDLSVIGAEMYFFVDSDSVENLEWVPSDSFDLYFPVETGASFVYGVTQASELSINTEQIELGRLMVTKKDPNQKVKIKLLSEGNFASKVNTDLESEFNFAEVSVEI